MRRRRVATSAPPDPRALRATRWRGKLRLARASARSCACSRSTGAHLRQPRCAASSVRPRPFARAAAGWPRLSAPESRTRRPSTPRRTTPSSASPLRLLGVRLQHVQIRRVANRAAVVRSRTIQLSERHLRAPRELRTPSVRLHAQRPLCARHALSARRAARRVAACREASFGRRERRSHVSGRRIRRPQRRLQLECWRQHRQLLSPARAGGAERVLLRCRNHVSRQDRRGSGRAGLLRFLCSLQLRFQRHQRRGVPELDAHRGPRTAACAASGRAATSAAGGRAAAAAGVLCAATARAYRSTHPR